MRRFHNFIRKQNRKRIFQVIILFIFGLCEEFSVKNYTNLYMYRNNVCMPELFNLWERLQKQQQQ